MRAQAINEEPAHRSYSLVGGSSTRQGGAGCHSQEGSCLEPTAAKKRTENESQDEVGKDKQE